MDLKLKLVFIPIVVVVTEFQYLLGILVGQGFIGTIKVGQMFIFERFANYSVVIPAGNHATAFAFGMAILHFLFSTINCSAWES